MLLVFWSTILALVQGVVITSKFFEMETRSSAKLWIRKLVDVGNPYLSFGLVVVFFIPLVWVLSSMALSESDDQAMIVLSYTALIMIVAFVLPLYFYMAHFCVKRIRDNGRR